MREKPKTLRILSQIGLSLGLFVFVLSCSRKKNTWLNRNFHALTTHNNILYHGQIAMDNGKEQLNKNYIDDYWHILPIERMNEDGDTIQYGEMIDPNEINGERRVYRPRSYEDNLPENDTINTVVNSQKKVRQDDKNPDNGRNKGVLERGRDDGLDTKKENFPQEGQPVQDEPELEPNQKKAPGGFPNGSSGQKNEPPPNFAENEEGPKGNRLQVGNLERNPLKNGEMGSDSPEGPTDFNGPNQGRARNFGTAQGDYFMADTAAEVSRPTAEQFERAEEKATKAIQKHSMRIDGKEHNPQMAPAFLLLGKARYYDQRFFPAMEAFNYILHNYENEAATPTAQIWLEKTFIALGHYDNPIKNLIKILDSVDLNLSREDSTLAASALGQAYEKNGEKENALELLTRAINTTRDNGKKGRYLFIKGQILNRLKRPEEAVEAFNEIIALNRSIPRIYRVNAQMQKAKYFDPGHDDREAELDTLKRILTDRENRPYRDIINYRMGEFFEAVDSMPAAKSHYNKVLAANTGDRELKARIYKTLGDYDFDHSRYRTAGAYYDSTMVNLSVSSHAYRDIRRRRLNLGDVIYYEDVAEETDSILNLMHMSPEERLAYFENYTDSIKAEAVGQTAKQKESSGNTPTGAKRYAPQTSPVAQTSPDGPRNFYFYDPDQVKAGKATFRKIWGERRLQDNWRTKTGAGPPSKNDGTEENAVEKSLAQLENDPAFRPQTYINQLPPDQMAVDSIADKRNFAYYQLGVVYKEKFGEYNWAAERFEELLKSNPRQRLVLPSKYHLYKIYKILEDETKADKWKNDILKNHSGSRYAKAIRNPSGFREDGENPENVYNKLYKTYKAGHFQEVQHDLDKAITRFMGDPMIPKMELLKATIAGRLYGIEAYQKGLEYISLTYPQTEEGEKAGNILTNAIPEMENTVFQSNSCDNCNLIFKFGDRDRKEAENLQEFLNKMIEKTGYRDYSTSIDVYNPEIIFVVVHGLPNSRAVNKFKEKLKEEKERQDIMDYPNFSISSVNYKVVLMHKNLNAYLEDFAN